MTFLREKDARAAQKKVAGERPGRTSSRKPASAPTPAAATPPGLLAFMVEGWRPPSRKLPPRVDGARHFAARREALSAAFPGELLVIPTGHEKVRANDTHYPFRPSSDFYYLTGNLEPDCVFVLEPLPGGGHRSVLFVEPNPGKTSATFFTDRVKGELWVGPRLGVEQSRHRYGMDEARPLADLPKLLSRHKRRANVRVLLGFSEGVERSLERAVGSPKQLERRRAADRALAERLSEMRLQKDAWELAELQRAVDSTHRGFDDVIRRLRVAKTEREVEGVFFLRARVEGNDVGYGTIAASGAHACTLHWTRNDGPVRAGDLLLLDAGVEATTLYTADVTRTLPVSGRFSAEQRTIYELVLDAQKKAMEAVRPGADFLEPNRVAMRVLTEGLVELGILSSVEEALDEQKQLHKRYTLHNVSHMLGLDVHDCAHARSQEYRFGKLKEHMVLTVEPGLYFQPDDLTVPERFRGIGVRIEDDVVVTKRGYRNLSAHIPRETAEVEAWMERIWAEG